MILVMIQLMHRVLNSLRVTFVKGMVIFVEILAIHNANVSYNSNEVDENSMI